MGYIRFLLANGFSAFHPSVEYIITDGLCTYRRRRRFRKVVAMRGGKLVFNWTNE
jgi:hypothetical protein